MVACNVKGIACSQEPTDNYRQLCSSPQLYAGFSFFSLTVLARGFTVLVQSQRSQYQPTAVSSKEALINPQYTICSAAHSTDTADDSGQNIDECSFKSLL